MTTLPVNSWTPSIPNMMKKVQHIKTIFPIGRRDESKVCTTSFRPGALLMTRRGRRDRSRRNTLRIPNILGLEIEQNQNNDLLGIFCAYMCVQAEIS